MSEPAEPEYAGRGFVMFKIGPGDGDYVLPEKGYGNLWRVAVYVDGGRPLWGFWRYVGSEDWRECLTTRQLDCLLDWDDWNGPEHSMTKPPFKLAPAD